MKMRLAKFTLFLAVIVGGLYVPLVSAAGQGEKPVATHRARTKSASAKGSPLTTAWPAHRPDGQPDVRGVWITSVYGMSCLKDPTRGVGCFDAQDGPPNPNRMSRKAATSRIIDTPDGEIPYQPWAREREKYLLANYFEPTKSEFLDPQQLCLPLGPVRQFTWHDVQIIQYDGYVIFEHEGGHVYQIVPVDGSPHAGANVKLWMGDSRGHWEGNTLVIDVTNNNSKGRLSRAGDFASDKVHNTVRIKFLDAHNARYEAVFDDPSVYTRPWTFGFDLKRGVMGGEGGDPNHNDANYEQWEEACTEGMNNEVDRSLRTTGPGNGEPAQNK
jgi:hypothetical protein